MIIINVYSFFKMELLLTSKNYRIYNSLFNTLCFSWYSKKWEIEDLIIS
jgi:hypothetical protein